MNRREAKANTRQRLIDAAIKIVDEEGEIGLTTTNITKQAGIAQSSFYVHFEDVNDLLHGVIDQLSTERGRVTRRARRLASSAPLDRERFREVFRIPLLDMIGSSQILRVTIRTRQDRLTPLGEWSRSLHEVDRRGLYEDLIATGLPDGTPEERERLEMMAEGLIVLTETMALGYVEGRYTDVEEIVDMLIAFCFGAGHHVRRQAGQEVAGATRR